jgi:DNA-directed RNA polymerase specialized sigma24 family protein
MAAPKLNARKVTEMRRLFSDPDSALGYADLASMFRVSEATVRYHLWDLAKQRHPQFGVPKICFERLQGLQALGLKTGEIARRMEVHPDSITRAFRKLRLAA